MQFLYPFLRKLTPHPPSATPLLSLLEIISDVHKLRQIHSQMIVTGIINDPFAASQLLCSPALTEPNYINLIFSHISSPNLFTWNTMVKKSIESHSNSIESPLLLYRQMIKTRIRPNSHTFMYLIKALGSQLDLQEGEEIHCNVVKFGFQTSPFVSSALIGFYNACGLVDKGRQLFDEMPHPSLVLWTAIIQVYVCANCSKEALILFREMREVGLMPDAVALATVFTACAQLRDLEIARMLHGFISKSGIPIDNFVSSAVLSMYCDSGNLDYAYRFFCEMPVKNTVVWNTMIHQCTKHNNLELADQLFKKMQDKDAISWNTMIRGLSCEGRYGEALDLFHEMELSGEKPNKMTLLSTLSACASLGALDTGTWIHAYIEKNKLNSDRSLDPGLIDMYSKCGSIDRAIQVFEEVHTRDVFTWTSIICGLAMHGQGKQAMDQFSRMLKAGVKPDDVTMVAVLNACAHGRLLDQGWKYFHLMEKDYNLIPKIEHYGCMIDLLGRIGRVREAYELITVMPMEPNMVIWGTLLSACRVYNEVELGEVVAKRMLQLDPSDPWIPVMLSNIYAEASRWDGVMRVRKEMKEKGLKKSPGCSSIEVNGSVHEFLVGDDSHPQHSEIHSMLKKIEIILKFYY
ncbi:Pentatricopeptide repeat [Macleaya cordata]|uniref:Pentatricopeptide repeat n=1 Tax=Macleaya cordata TaxID=56857 RepID=A0A200Q4G1_MACCD|nr:Pentatricopeptide repeat [Macleaya cordata]